jgi:hypothetical protein
MLAKSVLQLQANLARAANALKYKHWRLRELDDIPLMAGF